MGGVFYRPGDQDFARPWSHISPRPSTPSSELQGGWSILSSTGQDQALQTGPSDAPTPRLRFPTTWTVRRCHFRQASGHGLSTFFSWWGEPGLLFGCWLLRFSLHRLPLVSLGWGKKKKKKKKHLTSEMEKDVQYKWKAKESGGSCIYIEVLY